ncbi:MAG: hypothetical protein KAS32_22670, partial [Candidatus Peribacteraceae bacterium]|nr:hypothetical protein [Candidatus Peribacteraceae bacterium]
MGKETNNTIELNSEVREMWNVMKDIPFTLHDSRGETLVINMKEDNSTCRFRDNIALCGDKATWIVSMPGRHEMYVCDIHVKRYQQDKSDTGELREGRDRDGS